MTPRLEACYFGEPGSPFAIMAGVLERTAAEHCAGWHRTVRAIEPVARESSLKIEAHVHNAQKIEYWTSVVLGAADGEHLLLIDADVAILRPIDDVWSIDFDLAYTVKRRPFPFNLGVMFVRVSPAVRQFFSRWLAANLALLEQPRGHLAWRQRYGGLNQATFGQLLEEGGLDALRLHTLPCAEWNCEESGWPSFDPGKTRILHVKGALRRDVFPKIPKRSQTAGLSRVVAFYRGLIRAGDAPVLHDRMVRPSGLDHRALEGR